MLLPISYSKNLYLRVRLTDTQNYAHALVAVETKLQCVVHVGQSLYGVSALVCVRKTG